MDKRTQIAMHIYAQLIVNATGKSLEEVLDLTMMFTDALMLRLHPPKPNLVVLKRDGDK